MATYRLKMGVDVQAVQFTGINFMELFVMIPRANWLTATPNEKLKIYYTRSALFVSFDEIDVRVGDWLVVDDAGPLVVSNDLFHKRYERTEDAASTT